MSVATTNNRVEATGNGATTAFPVSFVFNDDTDLKVYQDGTLKTLTTHYTVSGGDGFTGTVTFLVAPTNGQAIIILRDPPKTQATSFRNQGRFFAEVHEAAFDKLTMLIQRVSDLMGRAAVLPDTVASTVDPTLPTPSAGKAILWNATADGLENSTDTFNNIVTDATAQAVIATTQAGIATTQAGLAATARVAAELAETNAETAETNAEAAAVAAQAAADSIGFRDVVFLTSVDSPYSVVQATSGKLLSIDTSGGAVTVTLPAIAGLTLPFTVGVKKTTGDANAVTINRSSTDTFDDGSTSKTLSGIAGTTLIPDTDPAPDKWSASDWGASTGQQKKQQFTGGVDYTAGVTTTLTITETALPSSKDVLTIWFDGAYQQESEWEYVASTGVITFDAAIPGGTAKVECVWTTPLAIGTPADATVSGAKLTNGVINDLTTVTITSSDHVAIADASDSGNKKKALVSDIMALGPRMPRRASSGTETLVAADMGKLVVTSTASTLTLPLLSAVEDGAIIGFQLNGAVTVTVQRQSTDELSWVSLAGLNSVKLTQYGDYLLLYADKTGSRWRVLSEGIMGPSFVAQYEGAGQAIGTNTATKLQFNTEVSDSHGAYDPTTNYRFTPGVPGWYQVSISAYISAAGRAAVIIYKNGAGYTYGQRSYTTNDGVYTVSFPVYLDADDYVEAYGISVDNAGTFDDTLESHFSAVRIR